jgi:hypothetical protein
MSKNWICLALLCWGVIATLLFFIKKDCSVCSESSEVKSTSNGNIKLEAGDGEFTKLVRTTANATMKGIQSPVVDHAQRQLSIPRQQGFKEQFVGYISKIFNQEFAYEKEGYTMIMLTYKRVKVLSKLLLHYCKARLLRKILVIWNDIESQIPQHILALAKQCEVTLEFIQEKENKLTNRFKPRPEIETECEFRDLRQY